VAQIVPRLGQRGAAARPARGNGAHSAVKTRMPRGGTLAAVGSVRGPTVNKLSQSTALLFALSFVSVAALGCANTVVSGGGGLGEDGANAEDACADGDIDCAQGGSGGRFAGRGRRAARRRGERHRHALRADPLERSGQRHGHDLGRRRTQRGHALRVDRRPTHRLRCAVRPSTAAASGTSPSTCRPSCNSPAPTRFPTSTASPRRRARTAATSAGAGGGSYWDGTVTIDSIDGTAVIGTVNPTADYWEFDASGPFVAVRCP
jgi:hypothetical protein